MKYIHLHQGTGDTVSVSISFLVNKVFYLHIRFMVTSFGLGIFMLTTDNTHSNIMSASIQRRSNQE